MIQAPACVRESRMQKMAGVPLTEARMQFTFGTKDSQMQELTWECTKIETFGKTSCWNSMETNVCDTIFCEMNLSGIR